MPPVSWAKEPGVRIEFGAGDPSGTTAFGDPFAIAFSNGIRREYRLFYTAVRAGGQDIVSATSLDGVNWAKEPGLRISSAGIGVQQASAPSILPVGNGFYRMFFTTWSPGVPFELRSALSSDGLNWTQEGVRISGARGAVVLPAILGGYRAYYFADIVPDNTPRNIVSAFSADTITWVPEAGVRVSGARGLGARRLEDGSMCILYTLTWDEVYTARSGDGLNFSLDPGVRMVPGNHPTSTQESGSILTTSGALQMPDGKVRVFYSGSSTDPLVSSRIFSAVAGVRPAADEVTSLRAQPWQKEAGVRLAVDAGDPPGTTSVEMPYVFAFADGVLRMYYGAYPVGDIMSATSSDGIHWTKEAGPRIRAIDFGVPLDAPCVVQVNPALWRMYCGRDLVVSAVSADGIAWSAEPGVRLFERRARVIDRGDGVLRMYFWRAFANANGPANCIGSAISTDGGLSWSYESGDRVSNTRHFAIAQLQDGSVVLAHDTLDGASIKTSRSTDGLNFTLDPSVRMVPGTHPDSPLESGQVAVSSFLQNYNGTLRAYYSGSPSLDLNNPGYVFSAIADIGSITRDRGNITSLAGGVKRYCLRGEANKEYVVRGSLSGLSNQPPELCRETLLEDDYYRTTLFNGDPLMSGSQGWFGPTGIEEGVYRVPPGFFPAGQGIWHALHILSCPPPPPPPPLSGKVVKSGGVAANGSSPIRLTVK